MIIICDKFKKYKNIIAMKSLKTFKQNINSKALLTTSDTEIVKGGLRMITYDRIKFRRKKQRLREKGKTFNAAIVRHSDGTIAHFCIEW